MIEALQTGFAFVVIAFFLVTLLAYAAIIGG